MSISPTTPPILSVSINEHLIKRRINNWYIRFNEGKIYGMLEPFGINITRQLSGRIISYVDRHIIANIECRLYALVPGNIDPRFVDRKPLFQAYLNNFIQEPNIVI